MDLGTLLGIVSGFGLVIIAMSMGGGLGAFINAPSIMIVCGGTMGAVLINYPISDVLKVIKVAKNAFFSEKVKTEKITDMLIEMSKVSRREGILGLEKTVKDIKDPFFVKGMTLMIDGIEPAKLSDLLDTEVEYIEERHRLGAEIFMTMGNFAPAMGMIGTLLLWRYFSKFDLHSYFRQAKDAKCSGTCYETINYEWCLICPVGR